MGLSKVGRFGFCEGKKRDFYFYFFSSLHSLRFVVVDYLLFSAVSYFSVLAFLLCDVR